MFTFGIPGYGQLAGRLPGAIDAFCCGRFGLPGHLTAQMIATVIAAADAGQVPTLVIVEPFKWITQPRCETHPDIHQDAAYDAVGSYSDAALNRDQPALDLGSTKEQNPSLMSNHLVGECAM